MPLRTVPVFVILSLLGQPVLADEMIDIQGHSVRVDANTTIVVDDQVLPPGSPLPRTPGLRAEARYASMEAHAPLGAVAAATVVFSYAVRGAVTTTNPLRVLGQEVTVTADTGLTGVPGGNIGNVAIGNHLDVSGYVDTNSSLLASFIEYLPVPTSRWLLSGYVTGVSGSEIQLGPQRVSVAGISPIDCGASVDVGEFVEIRADAIANFTAASVLNTVTRLTCVMPVPLGTPGALGAVTGIVGTLLSNTTFQFGPYVVSHDANTEFRFGSVDDLAPGATAEIDGVFGPGLTFVAQGIQFDAPTIRLEGPVAPADVVPGGNGTVHILANTVRRSAQLRDEDQVYATGINQSRQIEVRGYRDRLGNLWATRARQRGGPDAGDSRAVGPVASVNRPLLSVLGLTLDTTAAIAFEDPAGNPITSDAFFVEALPGAIVEQNGAWNGVNTLTGGVVALILGVDPPPVNDPLRSLVVGTFRGGDGIFGHGFE